MIHFLESVNLKMEFKDGLNITSDALNLVKFIKKNLDDKKGKALDIGAGVGTLTFLLYKQINFEYFYCVEIQKEIYEILNKNIQINDLKNVKALNLDIKEMLKEKYYERFEYIFSNPPYYTLNSGKLPNDEMLAISKFELKLNLKDFLNSCYYLLKKNGELFFIYPKYREKEIIKDKRFEILKKEEIYYGKKEFCMYKMKKAY